MNKENKHRKKAAAGAGLRRSALVERIQLREEWSALKETEEEEPPALPKKRQQHVLRKKDVNIPDTVLCAAPASEALHGVVALVEVGGAPRALALRAALAALGASVAPRWSPLVTHLVWADGGCRATRARARALGARLVSPLWVEGCAAAARLLPERAFPAASRASDLPSPRTLQALLKRAEAEGVTLSQLLPPAQQAQDDSSDTSIVPARASNLTPRASEPASLPASAMTPAALDSLTPPEAESRVNTNPRGGGTGRERDVTGRERDVTGRERDVTGRERDVTGRERDVAPRSRRKLFTQREHASGSDEPSEEERPSPRRRGAGAGGERARAMARAERLARRLARTPAKRAARDRLAPRMVLTGMSHTERHLVGEAVRALGGKLQNSVTRKTTHILLGSHQDDRTQNDPDVSTYSALTTGKPDGHRNNPDVTATPIPTSGTQPKVRTLKALEGAARGCRVLAARYALESATAQRWLHHHGYHVPHLYKISQKARAERQALRRMRCEYAYDIFCGMRVRIGRDVEQREACERLVSLCGGVLIGHEGTLHQIPDLRHVRAFQDGGRVQDGGDHDLTVGTGPGEVSSKWVFDSVAAGRMRTTRRYVQHPRASLVAHLTDSATQMT